MLCYIPLEIRIKIYQFCYKKELLNIGLCNKKYWNEVLPILWSSFVVCGNLNIKLYKNNLKHTGIMGFYGMSREEIEDILPFVSVKLKTIIIYQTIDGLLELRKKIPTIQCLELSDVQSPNWDNIPCFRCLKELKISNCNVHDDVILKICGAQIRKLRVVMCQDLTAQYLQNVSKFALLQEFTFSDIFRYIKENEFVCLSQLNQLIRLNLSDTDVGDLLFKLAVDNYLKLEHLNLRFSNISDIGLKYISKLKGLKTLNVECCDVSNEGISFISINICKLKITM